MAGRYCQDLGRGATKARRNQPEHPVGSGLLADHTTQVKDLGDIVDFLLKTLPSGNWG